MGEEAKVRYTDEQNYRMFGLSKKIVMRYYKPKQWQAFCEYHRDERANKEKQC